ncbi:MAG TPA: hypothetical protein VIS52_01020 [Motiliproteus sp.]
MKTLDQTIELINSGKALWISGPEPLLRQLPKGNWVGGTIPYFMGEEGGLVTDSLLHVTEAPAGGQVSIQSYDATQLATIYQRECDLGYLIIPGMSEVHAAFGINASEYDGFGNYPLFGWIAGIHLNDLGQITPKVANGQTLEIRDDVALCMHINLPAGKVAEVDVVTIFEQDLSADVITVEQAGFEQETVLINGQAQNLAAYIEANGIDTRLPLVADYAGAQISASFQAVEKGKTSFYAPLFPGVEYHLAKPVGNYAAQLQAEVAKQGGEATFYCNCILNFLYGELEGRKSGNLTGPATFGEIAYVLLNQTGVALKISDISA